MGQRAKMKAGKDKTTYEKAVENRKKAEAAQKKAHHALEVTKTAMEKVSADAHHAELLAKDTSKMNAAELAAHKKALAAAKKAKTAKTKAAASAKKAQAAHAA